MQDVLTLSRKLADSFKLVRIDWLVYQDRPYFNEMTFTPYSGMINFDDKFFEGNYSYLLAANPAQCGAPSRCGKSSYYCYTNCSCMC